MNALEELVDYCLKHAPALRGHIKTIVKLFEAARKDKPTCKTCFYRSVEGYCLHNAPQMRRISHMGDDFGCTYHESEVKENIKPMDCEPMYAASPNVKDLTIGEILSVLPDGFTVGYSGAISKVVCASSHFNAIAALYPVPPSGGGYIVADAVDAAEILQKTAEHANTEE